MNKVIVNYLIKGYLRKFITVVGVFYCFGLILNLLEEIEFFKNLEVNIMIPLILTSIYIPSLLIKILPFIIFISSLWFMLNIKHNKDLLTIKIFGFSNLKIFFIISFCAFLIGWAVLFIVNPVTSKMTKYYDQIKSNYSRDVDHLINFKRDGLWIKEKIEGKHRFIYSKKLEGKNLKELTVFHLDKNSNLQERIIAEKANISDNNWILYNVKIFSSDEGIINEENLEKFNIYSIYNQTKINNLFKNFDTMSFIDLLLNFDELLDNGYSNNFLSQSFHALLILPFFLLLMTGIASILAFNNLRKKNNLQLIFFGTILVIVVYYLKDFSLALGQIEKIPLILSIWSPIIALSLFTFAGIIQINEK